MKGLKYGLLLVFVQIVWCGFAQENFNKTFLYGFKLPDQINASSIVVRVKYNGKPLTPKNRLIAGKFHTIKQNFAYHANASKQINSLKLPFQLMPSTYYWVFDADMLTEMVVYPSRYQIEISTHNKHDLTNYNFPVSFDFISDNAVNIAYLKSLKTTERNQLLKQKTWMLSIPTKDNEALKDTILTFSIRQKIPAGILKVVDVDFKAHANQEFELNNVLYFKKELFFPIPFKGPASKILIKPKPDQCHHPMTDVKGNIGFASGCITGLGSGKCMGILSSKETIKYRVTLIIEP